MKNIRQLFGDLVPNPDAIEKAEFPIRQQQDRLLAIVTATETTWLGDKVYTPVSTLPDSWPLWAIESLAPIPFLSADIRSLSAKDVKDLITWLNTYSLRGVFVTAQVEYGTIGQGSRFAHGSTGPTIPILIESAVSLGRESSWTDENTAVFIRRDIASMDKVQIQSFWFYRL
jgi:hypothetical protein